MNRDRQKCGIAFVEKNAGLKLAGLTLIEFKNFFLIISRMARAQHVFDYLIVCFTYSNTLSLHIPDM